MFIVHFSSHKKAYLFYHRCYCTYGILRRDQKRCDFTDYLIIAEDDEVNLVGRHSKINQTVGGKAIGVDFDFENNSIFYSVKVKNESFRSKIGMFNTKGEHQDLYISKYKYFPDKTITHILEIQ